MGSRRPPCPLTEVPKIVQDVYGLKITVIEELESYDDRNFLVSVDENENVSQPPSIDVSGRNRFLVKIYNEDASTRQEEAEMINAMILHLKESGFPTPGPVLNLQGEHQSIIELKNEETDRLGKYILRLFDFHPGTSLHNVCLTKALCRGVGKMGGWLDESLKNFPVQNFEGVEYPENDWNLTAVPNLRSKLHHVEDKNKLPFIEEVISNFESKVLNCKETFSKGFIHSDLNDCNVLVNRTTVAGNQTCNDSEEPEEEDYRISSVIDWGDCTYSLYIFEAAIAMCYVIINKDNLDPMDAAASVLSGYLEHMSLSTHELLHLRVSVCARMIQSFVNSQASKTIDESNEYAQRHGKYMWSMVQRLWVLSDEEFLQLVQFK